MGNVSATLDVYILVRYVLEYDIIEQIVRTCVWYMFGSVQF